MVPKKIVSAEKREVQNKERALGRSVLIRWVFCEVLLEEEKVLYGWKRVIREQDL